MGERNRQSLLTLRVCADPSCVHPLGGRLCVKALLDAGADPESKDASGQTSLALADANGHVGTARVMRQHIESRAAEGRASLRRMRV